MWWRGSVKFREFVPTSVLPVAGAALRATAKAVREQMDVTEAPLLLLRTNKADGFMTLPGCAWPDKEHTSTFQFCENGAKAVTWEATNKRVTPDFFARHTVTELLQWSDCELESVRARLTHPMDYDRATDTYRPVGWDAALAASSTSCAACRTPAWREFLRVRPRYSSEGCLPFRVHAPRACCAQ